VGGVYRDKKVVEIVFVPFFVRRFMVRLQELIVKLVLCVLLLVSKEQ
jgi:hypothetical protein